MFYSGIVSEGGRKDAEGLRQQRRSKQSLQFIHKDSADLLPLDGLRGLGTSRDTQPHNILQRRLLESNFSKLRSNRTPWFQKSEGSAQSTRGHHGKGETPRRSEEDGALFVWCQCAGKEMKVKLDTSCVHNVISSACLDRLGLKERFRSYKKEEEQLCLPCNVRSIGRVEDLALVLGGEPLDCSAIVIDDKERSFSLGLQALRSLKCVINLEKNHLEVGRSERAVVPFIASRSSAKEERSSEA
ncbi:nuclear receptor-interacting protein 3 [Engystomops pustulosus]|uniref:nuclear receptor-interacting protein 3 n=1 Tax=Engystomops pustulosus TaxID=76066 RepID=UPI003AFA5A9C